MNPTSVKSSGALPVVLRVRQQGHPTVTAERVAELKQTWTRGAAWMIAAPMVCLSTAFGWYVANHDATMQSTPAMTKMAVEKPTPANDLTAQQPPMVASNVTAPTPPPRLTRDQKQTDIVQVGYDSRESGYRVDSEVARVKPPSEVELEERGAPRRLQPMPDAQGADESSVRPKAGANRAAGPGVRSRINGVFRIDEE